MSEQLEGTGSGYSSWLECVRGCGRRYSIYDVIYRCEDCGGLLDVDVVEIGRVHLSPEQVVDYRQAAGSV